MSIKYSYFLYFFNLSGQFCGVDWLVVYLVYKVVQI